MEKKNRSLILQRKMNSFSLSVIFISLQKKRKLSDPYIFQHYINPFTSFFTFLQTKKELFDSIEVSRNILNDLETKLSSPICLRDVTQSALDTLLTEHSAISRQIDEQSAVVSQLLNTSDLFLSDCEGNGLREYGERILVRLNILDAKWKQVK